MISIHTSAREVTKSTGVNFYDKEISIHTSAREVTVARVALAMDYSDFNPHFRKGSDGYWSTRVTGISYFNPHFRKGSDNEEPRVPFR